MNFNNLFKLSFMAATLGLASCGNTNTQNATTDTLQHVHDSANHEQEAENNISFANENIGKVYNSYISLTSALVASDNDMAKKAATDLGLALNQVNENEIGAQVKLIEHAGDLETKRNLLDKLSHLLVNYFTANKPETGVIYEQNCPMANNNAGGSWLSSSKKVQNPYYGDSMLTCGSNVAEIKL